MEVKIGTKYQISENIKGNFNSATSLTIISETNNTIQFTLNDQKGHGAMPIQHLQYLSKKNYLTKGMNKRQFLMKEDNEEEIV
ncbi:hypothetical protein BKP35_08780 [Anaerobacillus arseniciselenatis]|uniref:Uncharacterized protein n=1 Tax=Anaerobacillus arseniciselenatis TaxID=85682 RepID=A0A1S2LN02_9BACI|nr:hypothetical protein [Anaerobacillus arseniciselenatis]OIJ13861.1 hypothetical protein BKP35_08780 [Anaerobacillus arseniciselenatis]